MICIKITNINLNKHNKIQEQHHNREVKRNTDISLKEITIFLDINRTKIFSVFQVNNKIDKIIFLIYVLVIKIKLI